MNRIRNLFRKGTEAEESSRNKEAKTKISKPKSVKIESETTSLAPPSSAGLVAESKASIASLRFIEATNNHNMEALIALFASNCIVLFEDAEFSIAALIETMTIMIKSFPDFKFSYEKIVDVGPNQAKICKFSASGTHTGEPYGFGPFPPIAATGIKVLNDPAQITMTIDERTGLITKLHNVSNGLSGPQGLYQQIGGILS